jgi:hypothetical protein
MNESQTAIESGVTLESSSNLSDRASAKREAAARGVRHQRLVTARPLAGAHQESLISSSLPRDGAVGDGLRVLVGCERSGVVRDAFSAAGCDAW